jgi:hypothetical protein
MTPSKYRLMLKGLYTNKGSEIVTLQHLGFLGVCPLTTIQFEKEKKKTFQELHILLFSGESNVNLCGPVFGSYEKGVSLNRIN